MTKSYRMTRYVTVMADLVRGCSDYGIIFNHFNTK